jgi:predicted metal-binding membrane protein
MHHGLAQFTANWILMLFAMMAPVLVPSLLHITQRTFRERRGRSIGLFVAGYASIWMVADVALLCTTTVLKLAVPKWQFQAAAGLLVALLWQCSPFKQRYLNRCHAAPALSAFGLAADFDVVRFGITQGIWCVGSCWALMLLPTELPVSHVITTSLVALLIFAERFEQPTRPRWRWRGPGKVKRILVAQVPALVRTVRVRFGRPIDYRA